MNHSPAEREGLPVMRVALFVFWVASSQKSEVRSQQSEVSS